MTPRHHPDATDLLAYAAGTLREGFALLVATHLAACRTCQDEVATFDAVGGVFLGSIAPAAMAPNALARALVAIDAQPVGAMKTAEPATEWWQREPLAPYLRRRPPRWRPLAHGLAYSILLRRRRDGVTALLLRAAPGAALPSHEHTGREMNQIIVGGFSDGRDSFAAGDFMAIAGNERHKPRADRDGECITLIGLEGPLLFRSRMARLLQRIAGI